MAKYGARYRPSWLAMLRLSLAFPSFWFVPLGRLRQTRRYDMSGSYLFIMPIISSLRRGWFPNSARLHVAAVLAAAFTIVEAFMEAGGESHDGTE